jgi:hypothetical protein
LQFRRKAQSRRKSIPDLCWQLAGRQTSVKAPRHERTFEEPAPISRRRVFPMQHNDNRLGELVEVPKTLRVSCLSAS